jgi:hypothetical protein
VKYQVVIGFPDFMPIDVAGPYLGRENDAGIWAKTGIVDYLKDNGFFVLGDKGYVGCEQVHHMMKKKRGQQVLSVEDKNHNREIAHYRVRVENHFAKLKVWKVLSHVFRGSLTEHRRIFIACELLTLLSEGKVILFFLHH